MEILAGFIIGLLGSVHCIGMCGPIVLALPGEQKPGRFIVSRLLYNSGRVVTYTLLGIIMGLIGESFRFAGLQRGVSIALGSLILLWILTPSRLTAWFFPEVIYQSYKSRIAVIWGKLFAKKSLRSLFAIGILNGFLPCGFVYLALTGAFALNSVFSSALYMAAFGIGTIPILLGVSYAGNSLGLRLRRHLGRYIPVGAAIIALLLIIRGMSLGIPYVSPKISTVQTSSGSEAKMECCD